jgi:putative membrane protein
MESTRTVIVAAALAFAALAGPAVAAGPQDAAKQAPAPGAADPAAAAAAPAAPAFEPSMEPVAFLSFAAGTAAMQQKLGEWVMANGETPAVKDYARRMTVNHAAVQLIVAKTAKKANLSVDAAMDPSDAEAVTRLTALRGLELDKAYAAFLSERDSQILQAYRWQFENCKDTDVKAFATSTAPIMQVHQRLAEAIHQDVNKEEIRLAAERKAAEQKAAEEARAQAQLDAAQAAAKKKGAAPPPKKPKKPMGAAG